MKKRIFCLLMSVALLCGILPAAAEETVNVPGIWKMTRYIVGERVIEDPEAAGSKKIIRFSGNGTARVTINKKAYTATWIQDGGTVHLLYDDGDRADFVMEDGQLVYRTGRQVQYFTCLTPVYASLPLSPAGRWELTCVLDPDGTPAADPETDGIHSVLLVWEDGTGYYVQDDGEGECVPVTWEERNNVIGVSCGDDLLEYLRIGDRLICTDRDRILVFGKAYWPVEEDPAAVEAGREDYAGTWELCALEAAPFGVPRIVPASASGMRYTLTDEGDSVSLSGSGGPDEETVEILFIPSFRNGALRLTPRRSGSLAGSVSVSMCEAGWISMRFSGADGTEKKLFFSRGTGEGQLPAEPAVVDLTEILVLLNGSGTGGL